MTIKTLSSREFNQNTSGAKKAAQEGPVFITDHGRQAYVLLAFEGYRKLGAGGSNIIELLAMPGIADVDFEPPRMNLVSKPVDFTYVYVLDTNLISELRKATGGKADVRVTRWLSVILPADLYLIAMFASSLHVCESRPERDALIAATALVHGMAVVTRNVSEFTPMGVPVINPWEP